MPNNMIRPKGPYKLQRLNRRRAAYYEEIVRRQNIRTHVPKPKMTFVRLLKLVGYFCIFYIVLGLFAWCYMQFLFLIIASDDVPFVTKTPGLSSVPGHLVGLEKQITWRSDLSLEEVVPFKQQMDEFIRPYGLDGSRFLRKCNLDYYWGYASKQPCILFKLNFSQNFTAVTYNDGITLPDQVPMALYDYITQTAEEKRQNRIWLNCQFLEDISFAYFQYIPQRSYDADGLFQKELAYLQFISENISEIEVKENPAYRRILGVKMIDLPTNKDVHIKCVVWAKNIPLTLGTAKFMVHLTEGLKHDYDYDSD